MLGMKTDRIGQQPRRATKTNVSHTVDEGEAAARFYVPHDPGQKEARGLPEDDPHMQPNKLARHVGACETGERSSGLGPVIGDTFLAL